MADGAPGARVRGVQGLKSRTRFACPLSPMLEETSPLPRSPLEQIPARPSDVTPEWLTAALREGGILSGASVVRLDAQALGAGEGFVGSLARMRLEMDRPERGAPASLIAKFPIDDEQNKGLGEVTGAYEREIRFYRDLAGRLPIRTPRFYYGAFDRNPFEGREEELVRRMDRVPRWLVRMIAPIGMSFGLSSTRRYALLLEDLAPLPVGDQLAGCSVEQAHAVLCAIARVHAAYWERVDVPELAFLPRMLWLRHWMHAYYRRAWKSFCATYAERYPKLATSARWLLKNGVPLIEQLQNLPPTLLHGDYRLDNLCLEPRAAGGFEITAFDWQAVCRGPAVIDASYFLTSNLSADLLARHERELLVAYWEELAAHGVQGYTLERCDADYELSKIHVFYRYVIATSLISMRHERGKALSDASLERIERVLPASA
jgi:hypothetical protein